MNFKTFIILFLLGISCSCAVTYEKNFPSDEERENQNRSYETGTFNR